MILNEHIECLDRDIYSVSQEKLKEFLGIEGKFNKIVICDTTKDILFFMNDEDGCGSDDD